MIDAIEEAALMTPEHCRPRLELHLRSFRRPELSAAVLAVKMVHTFKFASGPSNGPLRFGRLVSYRILNVKSRFGNFGVNRLTILR